jgi:hypothetical protein
MDQWQISTHFRRGRCTKRAHTTHSTLSELLGVVGLPTCWQCTVGSIPVLPLAPFRSQPPGLPLPPGPLRTGHPRSQLPYLGLSLASLSLTDFAKARRILSQSCLTASRLEIASLCLFIRRPEPSWRLAIGERHATLTARSNGLRVSPSGLVNKPPAG